MRKNRAKNQLSKFQKENLSKIEKCENKVIKDVLRNVLNREPTKEDAKDCVRAFEKGVTDKYQLIHKGIYVGDVIINLSKNDVVVNFIPCNNPSNN